MVVLNRRLYTSTIARLHWLALKARVKFKLAGMVYNVYRFYIIPRVTSLRLQSDQRASFQGQASSGRQQIKGEDFERRVPSHSYGCLEHSSIDNQSIRKSRFIQETSENTPVGSG